MSRLALAFTVLGSILALAAAPGARAGDEVRFVQVEMTLRVIVEGGDADEPPSTVPLAGVEVRLFARAGSPPTGSEIVGEFENGKSVGSARTDSNGDCVLPAPTDTQCDLITRWKDPAAGVFVYTVSAIGQGDPTPVVHDEVIELIRHEGTVQVCPGRKQVVTG